jgi:hypothetical protein
MVRRRIPSSRCDAWARNVAFTVLSYDEARKQEHTVDSWMLLVENEALAAHPFTCEDGPELPKEPDPNAEEGDEDLERMYAKVCRKMEESSTTRRPGIPFRSDNEDEEMRYDQERLVRRFRNGRRPGTVSGERPGPGRDESNDPRVASMWSVEIRKSRWFAGS